MKKYLILTLGLLVVSVLIYAPIRYPRIRDVLLSSPLKIYLSTVFEKGIPPEKREIQADQEILKLGSLMAWTFDSVVTASGSFDYAQYPYWNLFKVVLGKHNRLLCGGVSSLYAFNLNQLGYQTRILQLVGPRYVQGKSPNDTHVAVEVKLKTEDRWVLADPTFDAFWSCGGKNFVTYPELHECIQNNQKLLPIHLRQNSAGIEKLAAYKTPPEQVFYAGRAVTRFKSYGWSEAFRYALTRKPLFEVDTYPEIYELPSEDIVEDSIRSYKRKP